ncbi:response regulator transcription factor [Brevibacillus ginsengisoli]|uniref:response regulator transcription factor n=1 Tax=Brevibacillus ginsengisoli TaxID=363854 RepID=UPI003CFB8F57
MKSILLIEDEKNLARFIELELQHDGFQVTTVPEGRDGLEKALQEEWELIILDVMLPNLNGFEICRRIRSVKQTPIIILTARDSVIDRVSGLDSGADDYIPKPFAIEELLARIRSILRRTENLEEQSVAQLMKFKNVVLDPESRIVTVDDEPVELTKTEYELLYALMNNVNRVLSREVLLEQVWGYDTTVETNIVDVYIRYLRNKLKSPVEDGHIQTVRGIGYVMRE